MAPAPENRNARQQPGVGGSGSAELKSKQQSNTEFPTAAQGSTVDHLLDDLKTVADWRDDLTRRMARGQLILETIGLSTERHDELIAEAQVFIRVCHVLADRIPGSLDEGAAGHERRAAAA